MPRKPIIPKKPTVLIVEGNEDKFFFEALLKHLQITSIQVEGIGGKTQIGTNLLEFRDQAGFDTVVKTLAVVRDADDNPQGAFQSVCSALKKANLPVPTKRSQFAEGSPKTGILILPSMMTTGSLEDVCLAAIENNPILQSCVTDYFVCVQKNGLPLPREMSKARIQVFLAAIEPDQRLGESAKSGHWDWSHPAFAPLIAFLRQIAP
jgi:hypothetical protein